MQSQRAGNNKPKMQHISNVPLPIIVFQELHFKQVHIMIFKKNHIKNTCKIEQNC